MAVFETWLDQDLKKPVRIQYLSGNLFSQDNMGNLIGVNVTDDGAPATLGGSVSANVIRADGATVAVDSGVLSGNMASVTLPQAAYAVPGVITVVIKITSGTDVTTLAAVVTTVYRSSTDTIVDPGTIIPSIQALISQIETAVASIPSDYSSLWTTIAPAYSTSATYAVGQYVTYNGGLYRCTTAITSAESWTAAHWTAAKIGNDLSDLKSAFNTDKTIQEMKDGDVKYDFDYLTHGGIQANVTIGSVGETISTNTTSNYKHAIYAVTAGKLYRVNSRANANGTYKTAFATDANDVIKQIWQVIPPSNSDVTFDVLIPTGATKLYVNAYSQTGDQIACKLITHNSLQTQIDDNADIFDDFIGNMQYSTESSEYNYTGSITFAGVNGTATGTALNFTTTSNYNYAVYTVEEGDTFDITTYGTTSNTYPYYCYLTDANNIIYSMELPKPSEEKYFSGTVVVPHGATKMYVLSRSSQTYRGMAYKITYTPKTVDEIVRYVDNSDDLKPAMNFNAGVKDVLNKNASHGFINIGFVTDTHGNDKNALPSLSCASVISEMCITDVFFHGGDYVTADDLTLDKFEDDMIQQIQIVKKINNLIPLKGNHDFGKADTNLDIYQEYLLLKPNIRTGIVNNSEAPFHDYGYIDFDKYKVRVIYLNAYTNSSSPETVAFGSNQLSWLYNTALIVDSGWTVIVFAHDTGTRVENILHAFVDKGTAYGDYQFDENANGELAAFIRGHHHSDYYYNENGYNDILVDAGYAKNSADNDGAFDVFTIDTVNKVLYETRIGRGSSRSYNYGSSNSIIV